MNAEFGLRFTSEYRLSTMLWVKFRSKLETIRTILHRSAVIAIGHSLERCLVVQQILVQLCPQMGAAADNDNSGL